MFDFNNIYEPKTIEEALEILDNKDVKIIAGGTDILIKFHHGDIKDVELLSIRDVESLSKIEVNEKEEIVIGSMATFTKIFRNEIINEKIKVLSEAAVSMGGPQIRNVATIGGNVCNGAVSADSATTLFSLNAKLQLESKEGKRIVDIKDFYLGPGKVSIKNNELLTKIIIEKEDYEGFKGNYIKFSNRKAMDIAMLGVSVLTNIKEGKIEDLRISLGVAAPTPIRCTEAEEFAKGLDITLENIEKISEKTMEDARPRNSWRGSRDFRVHLIKELSKRAIITTIKELGGEIHG